MTSLDPPKGLVCNSGGPLLYEMYSQEIESPKTRSSTGLDGQEVSPPPVSNMQGTGNRSNESMSLGDPPIPPKPPDKPILDSKNDVLGTLPYPSLKDLIPDPMEEKSLVDPSYGESYREQTPEATDKQQDGRSQGNKNRNTEGILSKGKKKENRSKQNKNLQMARFEEFNRIFGRDDGWSVYLVLTTEAKINIAQIERSLLRKHPSEEMMVRKMANKENQYLIKTTSKTQSETFISLTILSAISNSKNDDNT